MAPNIGPVKLGCSRDLGHSPINSEELHFNLHYLHRESFGCAYCNASILPLVTFLNFYKIIFLRSCSHNLTGHGTIYDC